MRKRCPIFAEQLFNIKRLRCPIRAVKLFNQRRYIHRDECAAIFRLIHFKKVDFKAMISEINPITEAHNVYKRLADYYANFPIGMVFDWNRVLMPLSMSKETVSADTRCVERAEVWCPKVAESDVPKLRAPLL
jgi:hypothetical protein